MGSVKGCRYSPTDAWPPRRALVLWLMPASSLRWLAPRTHIHRCRAPPLPPTKLPGPSPGTQNGVTLVTDVLLPHRGSGDTSASGIQTLYPSRTNSDLVVLFETSPNTIFGVSETWLDDTIFEGQIADTQKFSIFRKDRISSRGAGVALIVLSQFTCERRRNLKHIVAWMPASPQYQHTCVHSLHSAVNISYFYLIQIREKKKN